MDEANDAQQERQKQKHPASMFVCFCMCVHVCVCVCVCVCVGIDAMHTRACLGTVFTPGAMLSTVCVCVHVCVCVYVCVWCLGNHTNLSEVIVRMGGPVVKWDVSLSLKVMDDTVILHRPAGEVHPGYRPLELLLKDEELNKPVFLGDKAFYKSMNSKQRQRFFDSVTLSFPVDILKYSPGGSIGNVMFVWRVPLSRTESQMMTDAIQQTVLLKPQLSEYHTRQQRIDFASTYSSVVKISPAI